MLIAAVAVVALAFNSISSAAESGPRPWLCREIPIFSASQPMTWHATRTGAGRWLVAFMHYDPVGGHDGFTLVSTREVGSSTTGTLAAGQYYAVALHRVANHWICPANASDSDDLPAGTISQLCYGHDDDSCDVKLLVMPTR